MTKDEFLNDEHVKGFVDWMSNILDGEVAKPIFHSYCNRRTNERWSCSSIYNAFEKYDWPIKEGSCFKCNAKKLKYLQGLLLSAFGKKTEANRDAAVCEAAVQVMEWGGVVAGNVSWLRAHQNGLAEMIKSVHDDLNKGDCGQGALADGSEIRFNAGMTKVYSLICENFIIYDSRVAAAVGWLITKYCQSKSIKKIPDLLKFPWAPAKEANGHDNKKRRNPSVGNLKFPRLQSGLMHAKWNLRASWLLEEVLKKSESEFKQREEPLRALEAALFMIGYDLNPMQECMPNGSIGKGGESGTREDEAPNWIECYSRARRKPFYYCITEKGIEVLKPQKDKESQKAQRVALCFSNDELYTVLCELWNKFKSGPFRLNNSATKVRSGNCENGLGRVYFDKLNRNPPDTSKLAAILEELNVFVPAGDRTPLAWKLADHVIEGFQSEKGFNIGDRLDRERGED